MLSRVANSLYWMNRYLERADNTARLVDVNLQLLLDHRALDERALAGHWIPIVQSAGDEKLFASLHTRATGKTVTEFLVFQPENTNSILGAVSQARENARMVRDQITESEVWEEINRLYLFLRSPAARQLLDSSPIEFFQEIKASSLYLQGLINATVLRNEGWLFQQAGKYLERADKTSRILDVRHASLPARGGSAAPWPRRAPSSGRRCCARAARGMPTSPFTARTSSQRLSRNSCCCPRISPVPCASVCSG